MELVGSSEAHLTFVLWQHRVATMMPKSIFQAPSLNANQVMTHATNDHFVASNIRCHLRSIRLIGQVISLI